MRSVVTRVSSVVLRIVVCCVAACGALAACGQASGQSVAAAPADTPAQCVQAVFGVLSGMFTRPHDNGPFQSFVTRYGTGSVTYDAYLDVFAPFYRLSAAGGVSGAESRLRPIVAHDCAAAS